MSDLPRAVRDPDILANYAVDSSPGIVGTGDFELVRARDTADVVEVLRVAQASGTPVVPQGARTGLNGAAVAVEGSIVLNTEALNSIEQIDPLQQLAVCGPGVINEDLKRAVRAAGMFYPPDPASSASCTIGGNVATNAGGLCCVKYGVTSDYIVGLEVVLPGGEQISTGKRTSKNSAGLDLTGLFVGSEGTLGVVTRVWAKIIPEPAPALTALATFASLDRAADAVLELRREPHPPCLLEFLDAPSLAAIQNLGDYGFPQDCQAALIVQADRSGHVGEDLARYADLMQRSGADDVAVADTAAEAQMLLAGRRVLNTALAAKGMHLMEDMCVPVASLKDLVRGGQEICARHGLEVTMSGHGGDGNLHPAIFFDRDDPDQARSATAAFGQMVGLTLELGGTISGEHGIGTVKAPYLTRQVGAAAIERMRAVRRVFDPSGIMNPGKSYLGG